MCLKPIAIHCISGMYGKLALQSSSKNLNIVLALVGKLAAYRLSALKIWRAFSRTKSQLHSVQILYYCLLVFRARNFCPHETFIEKHVCTICSSMQDVEKIAIRVSTFLFYISAKGDFFFQKVQLVFQISQSLEKNIPKNYPELEI